MLSGSIPHTAQESENLQITRCIYFQFESRVLPQRSTLWKCKKLEIRLSSSGVSSMMDPQVGG